MGGEPAVALRAVEGDFLDLVQEIFEREGATEYLGEAVTMAEHMLQTAARAEEAGASEAMVAAALLHDIGHFAGARADAGDWHRKHDLAGARFLEGRFGPEVIGPVRLHVAAKRYLCAVEPAYLERLSPASVHTLEKQGGPMGADEVAAFEAEPFHREAVELRRWEEDGKAIGREVPSFAHYRPLLERARIDR